MTPDPGSLLPVALQAAGIAADMMRTRRPAKVTEKHDRDLVSDVDLAIERQVRAHLAKVTPDIGFLGEEETPIFAFTNRGKKSVVIDLKDGQGKMAFEKLAAKVDVALRKHVQAFFGGDPREVSKSEIRAANCLCHFVAFEIDPQLRHVHLLLGDA